jgi:hypothetical protein
LLNGLEKHVIVGYALSDIAKPKITENIKIGIVVLEFKFYKVGAD